MTRKYPFEWVEVPDEELEDSIPNASGGYIRFLLFSEYSVGTA
jgi:hypothetical protein